jgi:hypothetical protein
MQKRHTLMHAQRHPCHCFSTKKTAVAHLSLNDLVPTRDLFHLELKRRPNAVVAQSSRT